MTAPQRIRELKPEDLDVAFNPASWDFATTKDLEPLDRIIGQPRAMKALDLGLGIRHSTYNVYVAGLNGTGKMETIRNALQVRIADGAAPPDWVYVNNFEEPDRPMAVDLEAGEGVRFRTDMDSVIQQLRNDLPKAFRQEDFSREKQRLGREYEEENRRLFDEIESLARKKGLTIQQTQEGQIGMAPLKNGQPMSLEEYDQLPDEEKKQINEHRQDLTEEMEAALSRGRELKRRLGADVRQVEREFAARIIDPYIDEVRKRHAHKKLDSWYDRVREHMLDHLDRFRREDGGQTRQFIQALGLPAPSGEPSYTEYRVNVVVDNGRKKHPPVIIEHTPNYKNLFGTTAGAIDRFGRTTGDFTHIRSGSLLRANGGYLVLNLLDALMEPLVWKELKRSIKSGFMEFHAYDPLGILTAAAIRPEAIPLNVKLVVLGSPLVYHLLHLYDEDFGEIFKVKADFVSEMERTDETGRELGRFIQKIARGENLAPFDPAGVAEVARAAVRLSGHREKVTAEFSKIADVVREASYWARREDAECVGAEHVRRALEEKVYRSDWIADKLRELIREGTLLISLDTSVTGQVNGLSIINLGDYAFGKPSRITASVGVGAAGVINVERESKLSGQTYDKAMLILDGYLRHMYAKRRAISLSAGIAMEQSYGMIEGDSATLAEILCLLSSLALIPMRQDIAVTGSVNQWGEVQAVGGINRKIEGFFDVCRENGLTGRQGVCIPAANVRHLILRPDVIDAVADNRFHVWPVMRVDEALELLSDVPAGTPEEKDTFHGKVQDRLISMADMMKERTVGGVKSETSVESPASAPRDPRPPLPGKE